MNRTKSIIMLLSIFAVLSLHSCEPEVDMIDLFEVSATNISLNYQGLLESGESAEIEIASSRSWIVASKPDWVELSKNEGKRGRFVIFLTVEETGTGADRTGEIIFQSQGKNIAIDIEQGKKTEELSVSPLEIAVNRRGLSGEGKTPLIYISTNSDWLISDLPTWIQVDQVEGEAGEISVSLAVEKNHTGELREGSFTIISGSKTETVLIKQDLSYPPLTQTTSITGDQTGEITGESVTFEINSIESWTLTSDNWIHLTPTNGNPGTTEVTVRLDPTTVARTGTITITDVDNFTSVISVIQEVLVPDDGKEIGYVYLRDDFLWVKPYGGQDELLKEPTTEGHGTGYAGSTKNMHTTGPTGIATVSAAQAFADHNYEDINWDGNAFYFGAHYMKMGRTGIQTGIKLTSIPNITADRSTNVKLTFNATPTRGGSSGSGFDDVILMVEIEGPGSVGIDDNKTKYKDDLDIQIPDNSATDWYWIEKSVILYGITAETRITIKPSSKTLGGRYNRWLINDIQLEKHSIANK